MKAITIFAVLMFSLIGLAQDVPMWNFLGDQEHKPTSLKLPDGELPERYSLFEFNVDEFTKLAKARPNPGRGRILLPVPEGHMRDYAFWDSEVMDPQLASENPEITTYQGEQLANKNEIVRFDLNERIFHARTLTDKGFIYISPLIGSVYMVYYEKDYRPLPTFGCESEEDALDEIGLSSKTLINYGTTLRTYRFAVSATGEYTAAVGGTKALALASIVTAVNFINGIYELEVGVRLILIPTNSNIIYTNAATDPFTPASGNSAMLSQNQTSTDSVIGSANYDIGHVLHATAGTGNSGSGVATLTSPCRAGVKARGVTTASRIGLLPMNPFIYRIFAHELGHQFGAHHSFNSSCNNNRTAETAYEPGGGSTIMSYAGGCSPFNVQTLADTYFHRISLEEISAFLGGTGSICDNLILTGNAIPTANAGANYVIPRSTPFVLTGAGLDADLDTLTYSWEQYNNEIAVMPPQATSTVGPNFRSFTPTISESRYFPRLADILANTMPTWEVLPSVARTMNFSLVVRDNVGGASSDDMVVTVAANSGPFLVISPNGGETRSGSMVVTWDRANTHLSPVNAAFVDIYLSVDNGNTYPYILANNTPNDASQSVVLPNVSSTTARVQVKADANIFFDVSNAPFRITPIN